VRGCSKFSLLCISRLTTAFRELPVQDEEEKEREVDEDEIEGREDPDTS
jgi:hypothetical protein